LAFEKNGGLFSKNERNSVLVHCMEGIYHGNHLISFLAIQRIEEKIIKETDILGRWGALKI